MIPNMMRGPIQTFGNDVTNDKRPTTAQPMLNNIHSGWDDFVKLMEARLPFEIMTADTTFPRVYVTEVPIPSHLTSSVQFLPSAEIVAPSVRVIFLSMIR